MNYVPNLEQSVLYSYYDLISISAQWSMIPILLMSRLRNTGDNLPKATCSMVFKSFSERAGFSYTYTGIKDEKDILRNN